MNRIRPEDVHALWHQVQLNDEPPIRAGNDAISVLRAMVTHRGRRLSSALAACWRVKSTGQEVVGSF